MAELSKRSSADWSRSNVMARYRAGFLLIIIAFAGYHVCPAAEGPPISVIVQYGGWPIPKHKLAPISSGAFVHEGVENALYTEFEVEAPVFLPRYYLHDTTLHLQSFEYRLSRFRQIRRDSKTFAYTASATGIGVGSAADVWWADSDGDGKFEQFSFGSPLEIPKWVREGSK